MSTELFSKKHEPIELREIKNGSDFFDIINDIASDFYNNELHDLKLNTCYSKIKALNNNGNSVTEEDGDAFVLGNEKLGVVAAFTNENVNNPAMATFFAAILNNIHHFEKTKRLVFSSLNVATKKCVVMDTKSGDFWKDENEGYVSDIKMASKINYYEAISICGACNSPGNYTDVIVPVD